MQIEIVFGKWITGDSRMGGFVIPIDLVNEKVFRPVLEAAQASDDYSEVLEVIEDYIDPCVHEISDVEIVSGYGGRLSSPGYLDCTEWAVFDTEAEAREYLTDRYDLDEDEEENRTDRREKYTMTKTVEIIEAYDYVANVWFDDTRNLSLESPGTIQFLGEDKNGLYEVVMVKKNGQKKDLTRATDNTRCYYTFRAVITAIKELKSEGRETDE